MRTPLLHRALSFADNVISETLLYPRRLEDYVGFVDPLYSARETRAAIREVRRETFDTVTLLLEPNARFRGFRAGQYLPLSVELGGRRLTRCFSISSSPESGRLELTIKARPAGRVSAWANASARIGDIVVIGEAAGDFVLPETLPEVLVFLAAGSGVTPIASLLDHALARRPEQRIVGLVYGRAEEAIFRARFEALARTAPGFDFHFVPTRKSDEKPSGHFDPSHLDALDLDLALAETYVCGPTPLIEAARACFEARGLASRFHVERFSTPEPAPHADADREFAVRLPTGATFAANGRKTLLVHAEDAGLAPAHGCRRGLCHACVCTLVDGTVENVVTGEVRSETGSAVQLCVNVPRSNVTLAV